MAPFDPEDNPRLKRSRTLLVVVLCLSAGLALRLGDFREPWTQQGWQHMGATFAIMARNYVEQGYLTTSFAPATNPEPPVDGNWSLFLHHPPLFPLLLSLSFQVFGVHEWSARLVPILASLVELLAIGAVAGYFFGARARLAALAFAATVPVTAFYGSHVCELGPVVMAFACVAFVLYLRYLERPSPWCYAGVLLALAGAVTNDWPGMYMAACLCLHAWFTRRRRAALGIVALSLALLTLHLGHVGWATGDVLGGGRGGGLVDSFRLRTWLGIDVVGGPGVAIPALGKHLIRLYTLPVVVLAVVGLWQCKGMRRPGAFATLVFAGLLHTLIFGEGAARHEFWNITMAPFLLPLAGAGCVRLLGMVPRPRPRLVAGLVLVLSASAWGARETVHRFDGIENDFHHTLGTIIHENTEPGDIVTSCEYQADPMAYYARRVISNRITDAMVPALLAQGKLGATPPPVIFLIPEKKYEPHEHTRLFELLSTFVEPQVFETEACGKVYLFDCVRGR